MNKKLLYLYILSASIYATQGIEGLPGMALFFYLKEKLHFDASTIMYIGSLTSLAWLVKIIWGYLVDNYLNQKRWIVLSLLGSLIICLYLGLGSWLPIYLLIPLLMFGNFNSAIRDVANDGMMCVEGKELGECSTIQSVQWISLTIASVVVGLLGGYIADHFSYKVAYLCLIPVYLLILFIVSKSRCIIQKRNRDKFLECIKSYSELYKNKQFLLGCAFIFVYNFAPGFGTPLMFVERDVFKWSGTFMGILGACSSAIGIIGAIAYFNFSKRLNVKKVLYISVVIAGLTNLCYLYFTPVSAIVYSMIFSLIGMFVFLNIMTFMANSTIKGKEATSFALLCSINNLSGTLSTIVGAWLFPYVGLKSLIIIASLSAFLSLPILRRLEINAK